MSLSPPRLVLAVTLCALVLSAGCGAPPDGVDRASAPQGSSGPTGSSTPSGPADPPLASTDPVASSMLSLHNSARASANPAPSPPLPALVWSDAAASAAQSWANGCVWKHDPALSSLRMGQNLYAAAGTSPSVAATPADVVGSWVGEAAHYHYDTNTCDPGQVCGHYTAVVWRSTTGVGCGHHVCTTGSPFGSTFPYWDLWVCDYVPPGNWVGQRPY